MVQWKENPPGEEQIALNSMFDNGDIEEHESAATVQARCPMFKTFSQKVFTSHFNKTRAKHGYGANPTVRNANDCIPELGGSGHKTIASSDSSAQSRKRASSSNEVNDLHFKNAPYIVWVYADHEKQCETVCVAVPIISGARDVDFFLSEDNITLNVTYVWTAALTSPAELFKNQLTPEGGWTMSHPKIHSFMTRLHELELSSKSRPPASIIIKLPMKVQRESYTYGFGGVKTRDGNVVMLEFQAFQKVHVIKDINTKIKFE